MTKKVFVSCLAVFISASCFATQPNRAVTPGELCSPTDPNFEGYRYSAHVAYCRRNVTHEMKVTIAKAYGDIPESEWPNYEFDHLIPLNAGGASNIDNIWPQPIVEAHDKDRVEQQVFDGLNEGRLTQAQGVQMIWDWIDAH